MQGCCFLSFSSNWSWSKDKTRVLPVWVVNVISAETQLDEVRSFQRTALHSSHWIIILLHFRFLPPQSGSKHSIRKPHAVRGKQQGNLEEKSSAPPTPSGEIHQIRSSVVYRRFIWSVLLGGWMEGAQGWGRRVLQRGRAGRKWLWLHRPVLVHVPFKIWLHLLAQWIHE